MATRTFAINTEPHEAVVGTSTIYFQPEVIGSEFAEAYEELSDVQSRLKKSAGNKASSTKHAQEEKIDTKLLAEVSTAMRKFVRRFLMEGSHQTFDDMRLPDRVLAQLIEYSAELYGGGSGNPDADGGMSSD